MFAEYAWLRWNQLIVITEGRLERSRGCNEKGDYADDLEGRKREEGEGWGVRNSTGYNGKSRYIIST